ncbi:methionyl-tRNA formyltransferase [Saccharopolyspora sp. 5N708]|uniref:methionyl-tRNA formyltransferase n=1 Tax=Saccharopolyspora sp. 5N708 TaxID=3457424 RepID=UPI003FD16E29
MPTTLRVALVSFRSDIFSALHAGCVAGGNAPVLYITGRSSGPRKPSYPNIGTKVTDVLGSVPVDTDLLLPGSAEGMVQAIRGYDVDLAIVCGLSWRLPQSVLNAPKLGVLNVHTSLLPKYRGPAPVQWAIRNGDPDIGVTIHWMDERIDTGNIVAQRGGIALPEFVTFETLWARVTPVIQDLLVVALDRAAGGYAGEPQDEDDASRASPMEPEFSYIDWSRSATDVHNQVRTFYYGAGIPGPFGKIGRNWVRVLRTSRTPGTGVRVDCADGPIWVVETEPAQPFGSASGR